jgi:hypothetical protein
LTVIASHLRPRRALPLSPIHLGSINQIYYLRRHEWFRLPILPEIGTKTPADALVPRDKELEEETMPVIILWGIPTLIVLVGGGYWLVHMHH